MLHAFLRKLYVFRQLRIRIKSLRKRAVIVPFALMCPRIHYATILDIRLFDYVVLTITIRLIPCSRLQNSIGSHLITLPFNSISTDSIQTTNVLL